MKHSKEKKIIIKINTNPDRIRKSPVKSGQVFKDKKKEENKNKCRGNKK